MLDLAQGEGGQTTLEEIAERQGVPPTMMPGIVHALARAGLAETARGHGGGVRLGRPAEGISVRHVLESLERPLRLQRCEELGPRCPRRGQAACALREMWARTEAAVLGVWEATTLAELARPQGEKGERDGPLQHEGDGAFREPAQRG